MLDDAIEDSDAPMTIHRGLPVIAKYMSYPGILALTPRRDAARSSSRVVGEVAAQAATSSTTPNPLRSAGGAEDSEGHLNRYRDDSYIFSNAGKEAAVDRKTAADKPDRI